MPNLSGSTGTWKGQEFLWPQTAGMTIRAKNMRWLVSLPRTGEVLAPGPVPATVPGAAPGNPAPVPPFLTPAVPAAAISLPVGLDDRFTDAVSESAPNSSPPAVLLLQMLLGLLGLLVIAPKSPDCPAGAWAIEEKPGIRVGSALMPPDVGCLCKQS